VFELFSMSGARRRKNSLSFSPFASPLCATRRSVCVCLDVERIFGKAIDRAASVLVPVVLSYSRFIQDIPMLIATLARSQCGRKSEKRVSIKNNTRRGEQSSADITGVAFSNFFPRSSQEVRNSRETQ
jgi:hypothetical protein